MAAQDSSRVFLLEEEIRSLTEELVQCQADKDFVWSLWKRLQVANPELTEAVSLVVEREKQKAEMKYQKVLHILQVKDAKILQLEEQASRQQRMIDDIAQRKVSADQELGEIRGKLREASQELKELKEKRDKGDEEQRRTIRLLEEARGGLDTRCSELSANLERLRQEAARREAEKCSVESQVQSVEHDLSEAKLQAADARSRCAELAVRLSVRDDDLEERERRLLGLGRELQEAQELYRQSEAHAAEQAQLITQLEGLHRDAQRLLRSQEEAHATESAAQRKLYAELSSCFEALKASEAQLRQNHASSAAQLHRREQAIRQLQARLSAAYGGPTRQTNSQLLQEPPKDPPAPSNPMSSASPIRNQDTRPLPQRREDAPVQRSRPLSPASQHSVRRVNLECRMQDLEELLRLKTEENEELRRAHGKRQQRLRLVKERLREAEEGSQGWSPRRTQRPDPRKLRQEDTDAVWKELAFFRHQNQYLLNEKAELEETLDLLRVQSAADRTSLQELRLRLHQAHQEGDGQVTGFEDDSASAHSGNSAEREVEHSLKKVEQLERKLETLEREAARLGEANQELVEAKRGLEEANWELEEAKRGLEEANRSLQESVARAQMQGVARLEAAQAHSLAERQLLGARVRQLEEEVSASRRRQGQARRERGRARQQLLGLRRELGVLRVALARRGRAGAAWPRGGPVPLAPTEGESKDGWEDTNADSDTEEKYSDSLDNTQPPTRQRKHPSYTYSTTEDPDRNRTSKRAGGEPPQRKSRRARGQPGSSGPALRRRVLSLQQQVATLLAGRRAAQMSARELREANEKMTSQLQSLTQRVQVGKQAVQLTADLAALEKQKASLEQALQQSRQLQAPSLQPPGPVEKTLEAEVKQLQTRLKSSCSEVAKLSSANRALRAELQEKDERTKELQEKILHLERDVSMKKQLVEDLRTRMKILQDSERSRKEIVEDLERRVKTQSDEATNRKAFVDSLKRRLSVATKEKSEYELSNQKLRADLDRKERRAEALQAQLAERERALAELEEAAGSHMRGLAKQSTEALEGLQRELGLAHAQLEQLCIFVKTLASEIQKDVQDVKSQLRDARRRRRRRRKGLSGSRPALIRARSIAANILNVSGADLEDILDTDEEDSDEVRRDMKREQDWLEHVTKILQHQIPSAALLMDAVLAKMKEQKVLTEELGSLKEGVSGSA
ncbi:centlein isoform X2 [Brienomyrus brachyistius]|uniref:centlein isoform X2 n=1 Tax=Brienomyrus brachyistius TaxID=42636 RepID=UPI0020B40317|nr:centlein isoform X2 [Brienomyrus brachyistius]